MEEVVDQLRDRSREPKPGSQVPVTICDGREFLDNKHVYLMFSARAGGLTVGVNLTPDRRCNFDCVYCDVHRHPLPVNGRFDLERMTVELEELLQRVCSGRLREVEAFRDLPDELLTLKHVALSGEGEPTLCNQFAEAVQSIVHIRARGLFPFFKIVMLSNASVLDRPEVQAGIKHLIHKDEVWLKLDAGTRQTFEAVNRSQVPFQRVLANIKALGRQRPIVIQSLFPLINGEEPSPAQIDDYTQRLKQLREEQVEIALVQVYSATRPTARSGCRHLPLKSLSRIAQQVRDETGLKVELF